MSDFKSTISNIERKIVQLQLEGAKYGLGVDYVGFNLISTIMYLNILAKYENNCAIAEIKTNDNHHAFKTGITLNINMTTCPTYIADKLSRNIEKCIDRGSEIIIVPLHVRYNESTLGHANVLIVRTKFKTVEHFEPNGENGTNEWNEDVFERVVRDLVNKLNIKNEKYNYLLPKDVCPLGLQEFESMYNAPSNSKYEGPGFCGVWSLFIMELVLMNPHLTTKQVNDQALDQIPEGSMNDKARYLKEIIRGYVKGVERTLNEILPDSFTYRNAEKQIFGNERNYNYLKTYAMTTLFKINTSNRSGVIAPPVEPSSTVRPPLAPPTVRPPLAPSSTVVPTVRPPLAPVRNSNVFLTISGIIGGEYSELNMKEQDFLFSEFKRNKVSDIKNYINKYYELSYNEKEQEEYIVLYFNNTSLQGEKILHEYNITKGSKIIMDVRNKVIEKNKEMESRMERKMEIHLQNQKERERTKKEEEDEKDINVIIHVILLLDNGKRKEIIKVSSKKEEMKKYTIPQLKEYIKENLPLKDVLSELKYPVLKENSNFEFKIVPSLQELYDDRGRIITSTRDYYNESNKFSIEHRRHSGKSDQHYSVYLGLSKLTDYLMKEHKDEFVLEEIGLIDNIWKNASKLSKYQLSFTVPIVATATVAQSLYQMSIKPIVPSLLLIGVTTAYVWGESMYNASNLAIEEENKQKPIREIVKREAMNGGLNIFDKNIEFLEMILNQKISNDEKEKLIQWYETPGSRIIISENENIIADISSKKFLELLVTKLKPLIENINNQPKINPVFLEAINPLIEYNQVNLIEYQPMTEKPMTEKPMTEKPMTEKTMAEKTMTEKTMAEKKDINDIDGGKKIKKQTKRRRKNLRKKSRKQK